MERVVRASVILAFCFVASASSVTCAEKPPDATYRQAEAQRQDLVARQLDLNYRMIWQSGFGPRWPNPFEPWPRVPGDIWGYPGPRPVEHPVGQRSEQVGPNHWIYRPVYADGVALPSASAGISTPAAATRPTPAVVPPRPSNLEAPSALAPRPSEVKKSTGPREF